MKDKMSQFLEYVLEGTESAAIMASNRSYEEALRIIKHQGYTVTDIYETALKCLADGKSVAIKIDKDFSKELYDLTRQYSHRKGVVQVLPKDGRPLSLLQLDTRATKLLLLVTAENEAAHLQRYPELLDLVGIIERI